MNSRRLGRYESDPTLKEETEKLRLKARMVFEMYRILQNGQRENRLSMNNTPHDVTFHGNIKPEVRQYTPGSKHINIGFGGGEVPIPVTDTCNTLSTIITANVLRQQGYSAVYPRNRLNSGYFKNSDFCYLQTKRIALGAGIVPNEEYIMSYCDPRGYCYNSSVGSNNGTITMPNVGTYSETCGLNLGGSYYFPFSEWQKIVIENDILDFLLYLLYCHGTVNEHTQEATSRVKAKVERADVIAREHKYLPMDRIRCQEWHLQSELHRLREEVRNKFFPYISPSFFKAQEIEKLLDGIAKSYTK